MSTDPRVIGALEHLELSARKSRPYWLVGVLAIVGGFSALAWQLNEDKKSAEGLAKFQTARADRLQATLVEAGQALQRGDRARLEHLLQLARSQASAIGGAAATPIQPARAEVDQLSLDNIEVRLWICEGSLPQNRDRAKAFQALRPQSATGRWRRDYLSVEANSRANYRLVRNEIRYNANEDRAANQLQSILRQRLNTEVAKVLTFYPTPGSISIFFCEGAKPPAPTAT